MSDQLGLISQGIIAALKAHSGVAALVGTRIYPVLIPKGAGRPAITVQLIHAKPSGEMRNNNIESSRWQVSAWGDNYGSIRPVVAQIIDCLVGLSGSLAGKIDVEQVFFEDQVDLAERPTDAEGIGFYHIPTDVVVWS